MPQPRKPGRRKPGRPKAPVPLGPDPSDAEVADYLAAKRAKMGIPTAHHGSMQDPALRLGRCQDEIAHLTRRLGVDTMALQALRLLEADLLALLPPTPER